MKTAQIAVSGLAAAVVIAALTAAVLPRVAGRDNMPQRGSDDILSMVFGDARKAFSQKFEVKADEYFHGGMKTDCDESVSDGNHGDPDEEHIHSPGRGHSDEDEEHGHVHTPDCGHSYASKDAHGPAYPDPWRRINSRIHAQEHKHLAAESLAELLPWFWAACRMSPYNIDAYQNAAYVLALSMKMPEKGIEVLKKGLQNNPGNPDIVSYIGEIYYRPMKDYALSKEWFMKLREMCRSAPSGESEDDATDRRRNLIKSLSFLGAIAEKTGDSSALREYYEEARAVMPDHPSTRHLGDLAAKAGNAEKQVDQSN